MSFYFVLNIHAAILKDVRNVFETKYEKGLRKADTAIFSQLDLAQVSSDSQFWES